METSQNSGSILLKETRDFLTLQKFSHVTIQVTSTMDVHFSFRVWGKSLSGMSFDDDGGGGGGLKFYLLAKEEQWELPMEVHGIKKILMQKRVIRPRSFV